MFTDHENNKKISRRSLNTHILGDCQVCGQPAHGSHFGVLTCRACAAFFRRTVVMNRQYSCRRANGCCSITKDERYLCRFCRYNKCLMIGMTPDNVQWNRDVLSTTVHKKKFESTIDECMRETSTTTTTTTTFEPVDTVSWVPSCATTKPNTFVRKSVPRKDAVTRMVFDMSPIMAKLKSIMSDFKPDGCLPREPLQRMYHALLNHRKTQLSGSQLQIMESLSLNQLLEIWKAQLFAIGEWMMHCEEFARLPLDEKLKMFKNSWMIWQRFERITMSIELFGWRAINEKLLAISDDKAIVIDTVKFDFSSLTDHDPSYIRRIFEPFADRLTEEVTKSCLEVGLNIIEVVYVLCTLMWHVEGRFVNSETQAVAETYRERMSDNLHYYYTTILKAPNYAGRLIRLMTIVHCIENIHYERSKIMELARIFDIFKVEVSENGMFDC